MDSDVCPGSGKQPLQFFCLLRGTERIVRPCSDKYRKPVHLRQFYSSSRNHRVMQNRSAERIIVMKEQAACNIGTIRVADRYDITAVKSVLVCCLVKKVMHFLCTQHQVLFIKYPFRQTTEKSGHSVLQNTATKTEYRRLRRDNSGKREQILFCPSGSVQ